MNTLEITPKYIIKNQKELLKYAKQQFVAYEKIEGIDNWKDYQFSIDCPSDQLKFKDMLEIRFVEELTEATTALYEEKSIPHFLEEIADSLNFFLSAYIMLDFDFNKVRSIDTMLETENRLNYLNLEEDTNIYGLFYKIIEQVGMLCNLLKNRPWSQSNYLVDMVLFEERLIDLWHYYFKVLNYIGIGQKELYDIFSRKFEVNKFRIKTHY